MVPSLKEFSVNIRDHSADFIKHGTAVRTAVLSVEGGLSSTCVAAGDAAAVRAEALASLMSTARSYVIHRSRTPSVSQTESMRRQ